MKYYVMSDNDNNISYQLNWDVHGWPQRGEDEVELIKDPWFGPYLQMSGYDAVTREKKIWVYFFEMNLPLALDMVIHRLPQIREYGLLWLEKYETLLHGD